MVDVSIIVSLLESVDPDVIFVAGDLSDPHGTHRVCAEAIFSAIELLQERMNKGSSFCFIAVRGTNMQFTRLI